MSTIQDVIAKVQKLRRLATSSNINEAANAAAAADKLIQEHRLHESQLEADGAQPNEKPEEHADPIRFGSRLQGWKYRLASNLAFHYDVAAYTSWRRFDGVDERTMHFIGRRSDIETLNYQYAFFTLEIERLAQTSGVRGKSALNSFRLGAVVGLISAMREAKQAATQVAAATNTSGAMVLVNRMKESSEAHDRLHPDLSSARPIGVVRDGDAFAAGRRAGAGLHNSGALGAGSHRALGGGS